MPKSLQTYETPEIVVTFDPRVCQHSGICVRGLPAVFDVRRRDWVRPAAASAAEVEAQVARCPSGALQCRRKDAPSGDPLRYPVGKFVWDGVLTDARRAQWIDEIAAAPAALRDAIAGLSPARLDTPYRPGGWTVRQVVHHVPDSHLNAYVRFKLALTEEEPTIKPYAEAWWAELPDTQDVPCEVSLALLDALHQRWVALLRAMSPADYERTYHHPEYGRTYTLAEVLGTYAWHGRHHVAQITSLRAREGW